MLNIVQLLPYDERFNFNVTMEMRNILKSLKKTYNNVPDKNKCREKFTQEELFVLDTIIQCDVVNKKLVATNKNLAIANKKLKQVNKKFNDIKNSRSYRLGRIITWPVRKIKSFIKSFRKDPKWKERKPKVLFISSDAYKMSGAFLSEVVLNKILNQKFKINTHIVLPYKGSGQSIINDAKVSNHVVTSHDWIVPVDAKTDFRFFVDKYIEHTENLKAAIKIAKYALTNNYNIIHSNTTYTYVGYLASKLSGIPHVWHLREFLEEDQNKKIYCKEKGYKMIGNSQRVITISDALYQKYKSFVPEPNLKLIYNGISAASHYSPKKEIFKQDIPVFLFLSGSDSPFKGREDLISACKKLDDAGISFELWFVGWCATELQDAVHKAGLDAKTRFFGYQKNTADYYRRADVFFMCSRFEAFGRTTVEAMLNGCLVIGADSAGTKELIDDGKTGLLYPYGNVDKLYETIRYVLANKEKMRSIADNGRKFMAANMTDVNNAQNVVSVYKEVIENYPPTTKFQSYFKQGKIALSCFQYLVRRYFIGPILQKLETFVPEETANNEIVKETETVTIPKVSVIVPVYNVKEYLRQCLDSICNQTLNGIEIICVNDGSTDGSDEIINEYAKKDKRFIVINKENSGYGASVNRGLEIATGEYIAIVETDDFIDKNMYKDLYTLAIERGSVDIIKSSYWLFYDTEDGKGEKKEAPIKAACHPPLAVFDVFEYPEIIYHHPSIWSCLYKREFINANNIRFIEAKGAGWVDNPFLIETFCKAKRITWTPDAYYYYRQTNPNASSFLKDCSIPFERTKEMLSFLDKEKIYDNAIRNSVYKRILWNAASTLENPYYAPEKDDLLIIEQISRINSGFISDKRVRDAERRAYAIFMNKVQETND